MPTTKTRKSVPLEDEDVDRIARFNKDPQLAKVVVHRLGNKTSFTEAQLLHVLMVAGMKALEEEADEVRYEALAASQNDEDHAFHATLRRRERER